VNRFAGSALLVSTALLLGLPAHAEVAQEVTSEATAPGEASPSLYVTAFAGTTLLNSTAGALNGPSRDVSPTVGAGYLLNDKWALELDVAATWVVGNYAGLAVVPGVVYTINQYLYACARLIAIVHPSFSFAAEPGVGFTYPLPNGWAPFAELDGVLTLGTTSRSVIDVAGGLSIGIAKYF
jgi:hypothetical protein